MLWPPGHSSSLKIIGQFSMASLTPWSRAWRRCRARPCSASSQFSSTVFSASPPMKVLTTGTPKLGGDDDLPQVGDHLARCAGSGCSGLG